MGEFTVGSNWVGGNVPQGFDSILINNGGTVQSDYTVDVEDVSIGGGSTYAVLPGLPSYFTPNSIYLGTSGLGTLTIGSQAKVAAANNLYLGYVSGSTGVVSMDGAYLSPFATYIGYAGTGNMTLQSGSTLQSTTGYVGFSPGSQGFVNLSNSTWTAEDQSYPVDITVGVDGSGQINSTNSLISAQNFTLGNGTNSSGVTSLSGGNLTIQTTLRVGKAGTGNLSLTNSATATFYNGAVGLLAGSTGSLSVTNSSFTSTEGFAIGQSGNGTLAANGANFHARDLFVGQNAGATGSVTFSGGNMTLSQELHVGRSGTGTFTLDGGGLLNTDKGDMGFSVGSSGTISVLNGTWNNTRAIFVGVSGNGTLNIGAQGTIHSESGYIGQDAVGIGAVNVTGGSWTMTNTLAVGVNGTAQLSVSDGGQVSSKWAQLGLSGDSFGVVNVGNATWTTEQTLTIGSNGNGGQFYATNGANVSAGLIELGAASGVTGLLSVINSTLSTQNIGPGAGSGSVFFSGSQLKVLGGPAVLDTLLIYGFTPGSVVVGAGGLIVDTQGGNAQITSALSGNGSLTKNGAGRLRLTAANTFSGGTKIDGGVLEITNNSALSAGNVALGTGELRAFSTSTLSGNLSGGIQLISVSANQTGTFSAAAGQTLTLSPLDFLLVDGSTMRVGSAGNTGTVVLSPTGAVALPGDAKLQVDYGTLQAGNGALLFIANIAESVTIAQGATLNFNDQVSGGAIRNLRGAGTLQVGSLSGSVLAVNSGNFSGNIAGTGNLAKQGPGTLRLSGNTTLTGGTTVSGGTLQVDGFLGYGITDVQSGGTLSGNGTLGIISLDGGTISPGSSAGTLTADGLYWYDGAMLFDLGPASDHLVVGSLEGFGGPYSFTFQDLGWSAGTTYDLITLGGAPVNFNVADLSYTNSGGFAGSFAFNNNVLQFTLTSIPEPSTWALLAGAGGMAILLRMRRRKP